MQIPIHRDSKAWDIRSGGRFIKKHLVAAAFVLATSACFAHGESEASALSAVSALPLASVATVASVTAGASVATATIFAAGTVFVVKAVEASAQGSVYVLERVADGARVSVEVTGRGMSYASAAAGTMVTASVIGAGTVLSAAGEVIAFIPNELGRALLYNERLPD